MSFWQKIKDAFYGPKRVDKSQYIISTNDSNVPNQKPRVDVMSDFTGVLQKENIVVGVEASTPIEVLKYLSQLAGKLDPQVDIQNVYGQYLLRDKSCPTDLGDGIALPHAQIESVSKLKMFILKLNRPINWTDHGKVSIVISFLIPDPENKYQHVAYMSTVARLLLRKGFSESLKKAQDPSDILKLFK